MNLVLEENVSSADAVTGQTVAFETVDDTVVNGFIVIPRGSTAWATVTDAEHKRRMGRAGHVGMNIDKVRLADGEKVLLRAVKNSQGGSNTGKMVGAMAATAIFTLGGSALFLLAHGNDTTIPQRNERQRVYPGQCNARPVEVSETAIGRPGSSCSDASRTACHSVPSAPRSAIRGDGGTARPCPQPRPRSGLNPGEG